MTLQTNGTISNISNTVKSQCTQANASVLLLHCYWTKHLHTEQSQWKSSIWQISLWVRSAFPAPLHHWSYSTTAKEIICYSRCKLQAWIEGLETTTWNKTNTYFIVSSLATAKNKYTPQPLWFCSHKNDSRETVTSFYSSQSIHWVLEWMLN